MSKITYGLTCDFCDEYFTAEREHARFCSDAHRVAWHRARAQRMNSGVELADARRLLAVGDWRQNPTPARLAEAGSAMRNVALLEAELANACVYDQASINEAKRRAGR